MGEEENFDKRLITDFNFELEFDKQKIAGDLQSMVDEAMVFVKRNTRVAAKFDGFKRIDIEEYPYTAIREAIVNAVCRRDYCIENNVFVNIFDDKIEVISPGPIPNNLTVEEVRGKSVPRNRVILELFEKLGSDYVERTGTGFNRMDELMLVHGLKKPQYTATKAYFQLTFNGPGNKILDLGVTSK